jgi:hypothetical protein
VRLRFRVRSTALLFGILALALGGCGTSGLGSRMHTSLLERPAAPAASSLTSRPAPESESANGVVMPSAAVAAESPTDAGTLGGAAAPPAFVPVDAAAPPAFVPVAFEALPAERSSYLLAAAEPSAAPSQTGTIVAQRRGPTEPPPDVQIEEYDPWSRTTRRCSSSTRTSTGTC